MLKMKIMLIIRQETPPYCDVLQIEILNNNIIYNFIIIFFTRLLFIVVAQLIYRAYVNYKIVGHELESRCDRSVID